MIRPDAQRLLWEDRRPGTEDFDNRPLRWRLHTPVSIGLPCDLQPDSFHGWLVEPLSKAVHAAAESKAYSRAHDIDVHWVALSQRQALCVNPAQIIGGKRYPQPDPEYGKAQINDPPYPGRRVDTLRIHWYPPCGS